MAIKKWNPKIDWKPKDLRNALSTYATMEGIHSEVWEQYAGHAPKSVTARHYVPRLASVSRGEGEALDRQMGVFRNLVVDVLEEALTRDSEPQILNFFGPASSS